jgi:cytochrome P450
MAVCSPKETVSAHSPCPIPVSDSMFPKSDNPMTATRPIPGPDEPFLIGSTVEFAKQPLDFCLNASKAFGDICQFHVAMNRWVLLNNPAFIQEVLVNKAALFHKPKLNKRIFRLFLGNGLVSSDGEFWKKQHKMIRPAFHRERIESYAAFMRQYTHEMISEWQENETRDIEEEMTSLTLAIVAKSLFDADVKGDAKNVGQAMLVINDVLVQHINKPIPVPKWWPSKANKRKINAIGSIQSIVERIINERKASGKDHGDLLSMLVMAQSDDGKGMDAIQLRDEVMTLFFAGHETTSVALTWIWYLLAKHVNIREQVCEELSTHLGGRDPSLDDLPKLTYLDMVIKEGMRILPSVWSFMREPVEDVPMGDYVIPKGSMVFISPYVTQHDERFFPKPEVFDPERFSADNEKKIQKGSYVPFAAGPRICIGKNFALMEIRLILSIMLQHLVPTVPEDFSPELLPQMALRPKEGLPGIVRFRNSTPTKGETLEQ